MNTLCWKSRLLGVHCQFTLRSTEHRSSHRIIVVAKRITHFILFVWSLLKKFEFRMHRFGTVRKRHSWLFENNVLLCFCFRGCHPNSHRLHTKERWSPWTSSIDLLYCVFYFNTYCTIKLCGPLRKLSHF